jgi:Phosphopantetheine attachment site
MDRGAIMNPRPDPQAPQTPTEEKLHQIWCDILGLNHVDCGESFFSLSGKSIHALRLVNRVQTDFGVDITVRTVFEKPTVTALAAVIDTGRLDAAGPGHGPRPASRPRLAPFPRSADGALRTAAPQPGPSGHPDPEADGPASTRQRGEPR